MDRFLRIAMLCIHSSPLGRLGESDTGGMSVYILELAAELGKLGHHVDIYTRQVRVGMDRIVGMGGNVRIVNLLVPGIENAQRSELYDHLGRFCTAIADFAAGQSLSYDLIHSHYWLSGVVGNRLKAAWNCPNIVSFHTLAAVKMASLRGHNEKRRRLDEECSLLRGSDGVIVPTRAERLQLQRINEGEASPVFTIPCGVRVDTFGLDTPTVEKDTIGLAEDSPLLLFVGRFDPMKGIMLLLRSLRLLSFVPEVHLALIGGDDRESSTSKWFNENVDRLGIGGRVHQLGPMNHAEMPGYYQMADAVVISSYYESFGLVVLEALASGKPVASTPVGIAPAVIKPGENGYLAACGDDRSLAGAISSVLTLAKTADRRKIRASVCNYSWANVATLILDAYCTVLNKA